MSSLENQDVEPVSTDDLSANLNSDLHNQLLTFYLDKQIFGIPVRFIKDIFKSANITHVPLTPPEIAGVVNLRGHIVTAIDLRHRLCIPRSSEEVKAHMNIAVDMGDEIYSFIVDSVSEVMTFAKKDFENNPSTLDDKLKNLSMGIYKLEGKLLIVLDVKKIIGAPEKA